MTTSPRPEPIPETAPPRANILGVGVSAVNMGEAVRIAVDAARAGRRGYVCVTGVHGIMESQKDDELRRIHNRSLLTVPDGMPTVWVGRAQGHRAMGRVYGPDFMRAVCRSSGEHGLTHFLYGGQPGVADALSERLQADFPGLRIVGADTPPFRPLDAAEERALAETVARLKPDFFWVGLSTPKQERFMAAYLPRLDVRVMAGVGAAFDVNTGRLQDAPAWMKRAGLQWLHRLAQEPGRLWKRYLIIIPQFLYRIALQLTGLRRYGLDTAKEMKD
jgi:N-acetylglucosaminyldiphosphoundecaprenol N-acetyl-beta-D-mannosaminyltransferase